MYKQYTLDLKEKYHKFEVESQRHYANIIKKHQQQTDDIINNKEALLQQMKESKEQSLDELNLLRAKLYKARAEGVSTDPSFKLCLIRTLLNFISAHSMSIVRNLCTICLYRNWRRSLTRSRRTIRTRKSRNSSLPSKMRSSTSTDQLTSRHSRLSRSTETSSRARTSSGSTSSREPTREILLTRTSTRSESRLRTTTRPTTNTS